MVLKQGTILSIIFLNLFINDSPSLFADAGNGNNGTPNLKCANKSSLFFAEDLAIFSLSQKGLPKKS